MWLTISVSLVVRQCLTGWDPIGYDDHCWWSLSSLALYCLSPFLPLMCVHVPARKFIQTLTSLAWMPMRPLGTSSGDGNKSTMVNSATGPARSPSASLTIANSNIDALVRRSDRWLQGFLSISLFLILVHINLYFVQAAAAAAAAIAIASQHRTEGVYVL